MTEDEMRIEDVFHRIEKFLVVDRNFGVSLVSFVIISLISVNLAFVHSPILGLVLSIVFFLINGVFLGHVFFGEESLFLRFLLGILLLIAFLGLVSWATMIAFNLDSVRLTVALLIVAIASSLGNKLGSIHICRTPNKPKQEAPTSKSHNLRLHISKALYLLLIASLFTLLVLARSDEIYTVWQFMHPVFIPLYLATTFLLLTIIFSPEKTGHKLLLIIIHSILSHSFFIIIFPAGDISGQQLVLGRTRLIFDDVIMHGWPPWPVTNILERVYHAFRGLNFQTALSVTFARMFSVDVYWTHMMLVPILWGAFVPIATFMTTKALSANEKISALSGLLISLFPATVIWGTRSLPNSLGYIFFAATMPFILRYLTSSDMRTRLLIVIFSFVSFLGHSLTGIISVSLLLLALAFKKYESEKQESPRTAKTFLLVAFVFCMTLLPFALIYLQFFYPIYTRFSLTRIFDFPLSELALLLIFGQTIEFQLTTALIYAAAPLAGIISMIYVSYRAIKLKSNTAFQRSTVFLLLGIIMTLAQHRFLNLFMTNIPFPAGRLWMFRDFMALPIVAVFVYAIIDFFAKKTSARLHQIWSSLASFPLRLGMKTLKAYILGVSLAAIYLTGFILISGWTTISVYRAYPHYAPLQTTTYEVEAARYIDQTTNERYIVICDQWFIFAAEMVVGVYNPCAYYFTASDPEGVSFFVEMKREPTEATLAKAMQHNNASIAYFVIEKPRLGTAEYTRVKSQALENGLQIYETFLHQEEEKLCIFHLRKS